MDVGYTFSNDGAEALRLAAAGEEGAAIDSIGAGSLTPGEEDYAALIATLISIRAFALASALAKKFHRDNPASATAAYWHAMSEIHNSREDQAIGIATAAMQRTGQTPELMSVVGLALLSVQSLTNAGKAFQVALQQQAKPIVLAYLAEVLRLMGKTEQAIAVMTQCFNSGCNDAEAHFLAGSVYYDAGQIDKAVRHYDQALGLRPFYIDAHDALNRTLWEHGQKDKFLSSFTIACERYPQLLELKLRHAHFYIMAGKLERASEILEACERDFAPNARVLSELAEVRRQQDPAFDPLAIYEKAYALDGRHLGLLKSYGRALIQAADYEKAARVMQEARTIDANDQECIAYLATANTHVNPVEAARVNDYENFVQIYDMTPPQGFASIDAFNSTLLQALHSLHRSDVAPIDQTLVHGTQTHGNLFTNSRPEIQALKGQISTCVQRYIEHLRTLGLGEFCNRISTGLDYSGAWSVQLSDGGFHLDHVHSAGWISSVYYVEVPDNLDADSHEGWLKFGDAVFDPNNTGPHRFVEPKPGRLVLFPSFMVHGTVPITEHKRRTTVAFDVVPT